MFLAIVELAGTFTYILHQYADPSTAHGYKFCIVDFRKFLF